MQQQSIDIDRPPRRPMYGCAASGAFVEVRRARLAWWSRLESRDPLLQPLEDARSGFSSGSPCMHLVIIIPRNLRARITLKIPFWKLFLRVSTCLFLTQAYERSAKRETPASNVSTGATRGARKAIPYVYWFETCVLDSRVPTPSTCHLASSQGAYNLIA